MGLVLYDYPASGNCYKVRLLLTQLGIPYERRWVDVVDRSNRLELLGELNPGLRIPTVVLEDGRALGESNAILWFFGDGSRYVPDDPYERAQIMQWLFFEQYSHEPNIAVARFWIGYTGRAADFADQLPAKHEAGYRALDAMERWLESRPFLVGERYSIADIALYAYTHVADEGGFELGGYPAIQAWLARVAEQPGHVTIDA